MNRPLLAALSLTVVTIACRPSPPARPGSDTEAPRPGATATVSPQEEPDTKPPADVSHGEAPIGGPEAEPAPVGAADAEVAPFRRLVVGLFGFRRKQLGRGLRELTGWGAERVEAALASAGIDASARPETVSPAAFAVLLRALVDGGWAAR